MPAPDVPPRHSPLGCVIAGLTMIVLGLGTLVGYSPDPSRRVQMTVLLVTAGLVAASLWLRRRGRRAHERRLTQETAARAAIEDRLVIACELHGAVSGNLGAITVRYAVARHLETAPDGLRTALDDVETASREVAGALRCMLAVLRDENMPPTPRALATIPAGDASAIGPGSVNSLAGSPRGLVDRARRTGITVDLDADAPHIGADMGTARAAAMTGGLPTPTVRVATRVVVEALANTVRCADLTRAHVISCRELGQSRITVVDGEPAAGWGPHPGVGQGLYGLHETLTAFGEALTTDSRADTPGFTVGTILSIPTDDAARATSSIRGSGDNADPECGPASESPSTDPGSDRGKP